MATLSVNGEEEVSSHPPLAFLIALVSAITVVLLFKFLFNNVFISRRSKTNNNNLPLPPGRFGRPLLGESVEFFRALMEGTPERFIQDRLKKYQHQLATAPNEDDGNEDLWVFKTGLFGERVAVFCGPAGNKFLFSNENKLVQVWWPASVRRLLGPCLATSAGEPAQLMRKTLSGFLSLDALSRLYFPTIVAFTTQHIHTHWRANVNEEGKEKVVVVYPTAKAYTFELACRLFLSLDDSDQIAKLASDFGTFLKGLISIHAINFPGTQFHKALRATLAIKQQLLTLVRHRKSALDQGKASPSQDLLSHLLAADHGAISSENLIVNNILMLLFAGHDTTTSALTWLLKTLAQLPHVYDQVYKEQIEIVSSKGNTATGTYTLKWEDMQKMNYSWSVVCEVMRLTPSGPGIFREALVDLSYAGYRIPKGWKLYWSAAFTHKGERWFPDPSKFDPSRFEHGNPCPPPPFSFVPFGGGARMCIGKEFSKIVMLTFLHFLVLNFRWSLVIPDEKIHYEPTPIPLHGLPVTLVPHHH